MENLKKIRLYVIVFTTFAVIHSAVSQRQLSGGSSLYSQLPTQLPPQPQECGIQDKEQLPDFHAAAPWASALFYVEGDFFQNNTRQEYLNSAVFISRRLAITSGSSKILSQQQSGPYTKLQLFYGLRAAGKHTFIKVRKVEPLNLVRQPQPLKLETASGKERSQGKGIENSDLYLLHLDSEFDINSFSRPVCISESVFPYSKQYRLEIESSNKVHISGYASKNDSRGPKVSFTQDREWRVTDWNDLDTISVVTRESQITSEFLPKHFHSGSALTVKIGNQFFLAGVLVKSSGSQTMFRSLERYVEVIKLKEEEYAPKPLKIDPPQYPYDNAPSENNNGNRGNDREILYNKQNGRPSSSPIEGQISYLETREYEEKQQQQRNPSYQQSTETSRVHPSLNWGNNPRSTSRPDLPSVLTQRPDYTPRAPQSPQYNPNVRLPENGRPQYQQQEVNPYPSRQTEPQYVYPVQVRTTTMRNYPQPSHYPPSYNNNQQDTVQQRPSDRIYEQQYPKCSHELSEGMDIECLTRPGSIDCIRNAPVNTTIRLTCKQHYIPALGNKVVEKTCDASGNWLPRKSFACKLDCGKVSRSLTVPYIVHGSDTEPGKWPWHAAVFKKVNETSYTYICGATLINRRILVTAAHCVYNPLGGTNKSLYKVVVGAISSNLLYNNNDPDVQEFDISEIRVNEHYNRRTYEADIALIQIDKPVILSPLVRPVCFPFPSEDNKQLSSFQLSEGTQGIVVGFGTSENWRISGTLRMARLPVVSVQNCTRVLERTPSFTQYCAGYTNGTSVCEGDSGGAHIFSDQYNRYFIQGIISHGNRREFASGNSRCDNEKYTVFTKVGSFAEWVKEAIDDLESAYSGRRRRRRQTISTVE